MVRAVLRCFSTLGDADGDVALHKRCLTCRLFDRNFSYFRTNKQLSLSWPTRSRSLSAWARSKAEPRWPLQGKGPSRPIRSWGPRARAGGGGRGGGLPALTPLLSLTALRVGTCRPASEPTQAVALGRPAPSPWALGRGTGCPHRPGAALSVACVLSVAGCALGLGAGGGLSGMPGARSPGIWGAPRTGMQAPPHTKTSQQRRECDLCSHEPRGHVDRPVTLCPPEKGTDREGMRGPLVRGRPAARAVVFSLENVSLPSRAVGAPPDPICRPDPPRPSADTSPGSRAWHDPHPAWVAGTLRGVQWAAAWKSPPSITDGAVPGVGGRSTTRSGACLRGP